MYKSLYYFANPTLYVCLRIVPLNETFIRHPLQLYQAMTENKQIFQVMQTLNIDGRNRTISFVIDKGKVEPDGTQHIVLQITEDNKRVLSVSVDRETIVGLGKENGYKYVIDIDCSTGESDARLTAEVVDHVGRDFWWIDPPVDSLSAYISEKGVEGLAEEFIINLFSFITRNIVKTRRE